MLQENIFKQEQKKPIHRKGTPTGPVRRITAYMSETGADGACKKSKQEEPVRGGKGRKKLAVVQETGKTRKEQISFRISPKAGGRVKKKRIRLRLESERRRKQTGKNTKGKNEEEQPSRPPAWMGARGRRDLEDASYHCQICVEQRLGDTSLKT